VLLVVQVVVVTPHLEQVEVQHQVKEMLVELVAVPTR
jgi:hypothetical protein